MSRARVAGYVSWSGRGRRARTFTSPTLWGKAEKHNGVEKHEQAEKRNCRSDSASDVNVSTLNRY